MLRLRVDRLLADSGHNKNWLYKRLGLSYGNFNRLFLGETNTIRFQTLERLCDIFCCSPDELFERVEDPDTQE